MMNNKSEEKQQKPRLFELWDQIINGIENLEKYTISGYVIPYDKNANGDPKGPIPGIRL